MRDIKVGEYWWHLKGGGVYAVVAIDAHLQIKPETVEDPMVHTALEQMEFVCYRRMGEAQLYFRPREEFLDGRFERMGT